MDHIVQPVREPKKALSPIHEMMGRIRREKHASNLNRLLNDPSVYPWVRGPVQGELDVTGILSNPNIILLMGQHGGIIYERHQPGLFEIHCQCYPEGRGQWMLDFAMAAQFWIFTKTECVEVMTRCPRGNPAARALAQRCGLKKRTWATGWVKDNAVIPADVYSIHLADWMQETTGLVERGMWFEAAMVDQIKTLGIEAVAVEDGGYLRNIGLAVELIRAGQVQKAAAFFARFAALSSYAPLVVTSAEPLAIQFGASMVIFRDNGDFYVASHVKPEKPKPAN